MPPVHERLTFVRLEMRLATPTWARHITCTFTFSDQQRRCDLRHEMKRVRCGPELAFRVNSCLNDIIGVFCADLSTYVAVSPSEIITFNAEGVHSRYQQPSRVCVFVYDLKLLICASGSALSVFRIDNLGAPVIASFETGQREIRKLIYSGNVLFTVGETVKAWKVTSLANTVRLSASDLDPIGSAVQNLLAGNPVPFEGCTCDPSKGAIVSLSHRAGLLLMSRQAGMVSLWNDRLQRMCEFPIMGNIQSIQWITKKLAVIVGCGGNLHLFDARLLKSFAFGLLGLGKHMMSLNREPVLFLCDNGAISVYRFTIPYKLWMKTETPPLVIRRCEKERSAARIAVLCKDRSIQLVSPATGESVAVCETGAVCSDFCYDRNILVSIHEDRITHRRDFEFVSLSKGADQETLVAPGSCGLEVFSVDCNPGKMMQTFPMRFTRVTLCTDGTQWMYACGTDFGEVVLLSRETYAEVHRQCVRSKKICGLWYHSKSCSLLVGFANEVVRVDLRTNTFTGDAPLTPYDVAELCDDTLFVGCHTGAIQTIDVGGEQMRDVSDRSVSFHLDRVTGLTFARNFFVSSSRDKTLRFWDYNMQLLGEVLFPVPLHTCALLNGKRHVLVGIDNAILFVGARFVFGEQVDIYDSYTDNFDMLQDPLLRESCDSKLAQVDPVVEELVEEEMDIVPPIEIEKIRARPKSKKKARKPLVSARRMSQTPSSPKVAVRPATENPRRKTAKPHPRRTPKPLISARVKPTAPEIKYPVKREPLTDRPSVRAHMYNFNADRLFEHDTPAPMVRFKWDDPESARRTNHMKVRRMPKHV